MGWLTSGSARTLVIESDEFSLRAAVVNVSRKNPRVEAVSQVLPRNVWTALPAVLERLSGIRIPKQAVVLSSDVVPTVLRLPLSPGSARSWHQMQQLLRWEFDALVAQHFVPRPLGEILVCRGLLTDEQYRSVRESAGLDDSAAGNLGDRAIERLLEQTVMEHGQGSRSDLDDCLAIQERLEQPLPEEDLVCGWAHPARTTASRNAVRSADGLQPWFACGVLRSVRDNWREELAQLGFRLAGIGPLAGCSAGFGQLTGEDASILEIRPGRIGLTEIRGGRIEDVRLLPVSQSAPTAEQCQSVLDQKSPHAIWLAGTHPDLTGLAEHMAASLEQPVKVLEPAKDPGVHPPGSMTPLIGAASSISSAHLDKSPVAAVVARDPAPPLRQRPPFWWTAVVCATVLLVGSVELLTQQQFRSGDTDTTTKEDNLKELKDAADDVQSKTEKPHFYLTCDIDMTKAMELRRQLNEALGAQAVRVTVNDLVIKACVEALKEHPKFNAVFNDDRIDMNEEISIGVAIATEEGLIVPAIMDCADKSLKDLAVASKDLADRARRGTLRPREYSGGTFAVSNLGMFDVTSFTAIIQPPQSAILAVGSVAKRAVVVNTDLGVADMMTATLSADHRIVDGAEGARFITKVKRLLESPLSLLGVGL